jgi:hypothetical protein
MPSNIIYDRLREINPNSEQETLGAGFAFPLRLTDGGSVAMSVGEENVKSGVFHIAAYRHGELYGTNSFGGNVPALVFSVFSGDKLRLHEEWLKTALETWEPRVEQVRVTAGKDVDDTKEAKVVMLTQYGIRTTGVDDYAIIPVEEGS